jgi:hypothetical protein
LEALVAAVEANGVTTVCSLDMRDKSLGYRLHQALASNSETRRKARHKQSMVKASLTAIQHRINRLCPKPTPNPTVGDVDRFGDDAVVTTDEAGETVFSIPDLVEFKQMPIQWQEVTFCEKLGGNCTVKVLNLSGLGLKDAFCIQFVKHVLLVRFAFPPWILPC